MSYNIFHKLLNFIQYHNAFIIIFLLIFVGFSVSLAASPDLRDNVYSSQQTVVSIDNNRILSVDLDSYNFNLKIDSIAEDDENYYIAYSFQTVAVVTDVWKDIIKKNTLTVGKTSLAGGDLGLYVAKQLGENVDYELAYLKKVQDKERERGLSLKVVSTKYAGLVGKFLDSREEVFPGYQPVVSPILPQASEVVSVPPIRFDQSMSTEVNNATLNNTVDANELISEDRVRQIVQEMLAQNQDLTSPISSSSSVIASEPSSSEITASSTDNDSVSASDQTIPITTEVENVASTTL